MENKAARQYLSRVKRALVCGRDDRCRLLERCSAMIEVFQQENPGAGYEGIVSAFGSPESFVAELLSGLDKPKVEAARKRRRFVRLGIIAAVVITLIVISSFWYVQYQKSKGINEHTIIVSGPPHTISQEEFDAIWESIPEKAQSCKGE